MNDTKNLAIFLALGIGVYFLMVRNTSASSSRMSRYDMGPQVGPNYQSQPKVTNSNYVDLASSALSLFSEWSKPTTEAPAFVPDYSAANIGPKYDYADVNGFM
jgi:hypothetical protein